MLDLAYPQNFKVFTSVTDDNNITGRERLIRTRLIRSST